MTIMVLAQPIQANVLIQIYWAPPATHARVQRVEADGTTATVRPNTSTDATGEYMLLSGGAALLYDTEAPFDVPIFYITDDGAGGLDTSDVIVLPSSQHLFLRDPVNPAYNIRIGLTPPPSWPECVPGDGIFYIPPGDTNRGVQSTNWSVNNRSTPISLTQVRAAPASSLNLVLRTWADRDVLDALMAAGNALLLDTPAKYGISRRYIAVGDTVNSILSRDTTRQWTVSTLPYQTVSRPGGLSYGTLGTRWVDICNVYSTFGAATAAGLTYRRVLLGQASTLAPPAALRTWGQVNTDFANWGLVNSHFPDWGHVLSGP